MKKLLLLISVALLVTGARAQWVINGPYGGWVTCLAANGPNMFAGTYNAGMFVSFNHGSSWTAADSGLPKNLSFNSIMANDSVIFVATDNGVYLSTDTGRNWVTAGGNIMNAEVFAFAASGASILAGTNVGVYLTTNNGAYWTQVNSGIPDTPDDFYIHSIAANGSDIFAGTPKGIFLSTNNGASWAPVNTGITFTSSDSDVISLALSGTKIFAATPVGVFLSVNNGSSWTKADSGLPFQSVISLAVNGSDIFATTNNNGIFVSANNGATWRPINNGLPSDNNEVFSIVFTSGGMYAATGVGVYFSSDATIWTPADYGITATTITSVAICDSSVFAGSNYGGLYVSQNNGQSWQPVSLFNDKVTLAANSPHVFEGTGNGLFISNNEGTTWALDSVIPDFDFTALGINGSAIFAGSLDGMFFSGNNGVSWIKANSGIPESTGFNSIAVSGSNIFAATSRGIYLSTNIGDSWTLVDSDLLDVSSLAVNGGEIFAGGNGVHVATGNENIWQTMNTGLPGDVRINSLAICNTGFYSGNAAIFAGTDAGVFLSTNNGGNWSPVGLTDTLVSSFAINNTTIFAGTNYGVWQRPLSEIISGIQEPTPTSATFKLYPNPASNTFIIETTATGEQQLQIFNVTGQLLLTENIESSKTAVDASALSAGVYIVSLKNASGVGEEKLVIGR